MEDFTGIGEGAAQIIEILLKGGALIFALAFLGALLRRRTDKQRRKR